MADSPYIFEANQDNFDDVVLKNSANVPVVVDFWADWCAPCKMLMPVLEQLVNAYQGKFLLAKVDTDQQQELAAQYQVRSLPTVKIFRDGQPVDEFHGAQPESVIRELVDRYVVRESDTLRAQAHETLQQGDSNGALELLEQAAQMDPDNHRVTIDRAQVLMAQENLDAAQALLQGLPPEVREQADAARLLGTLEFANVAQQAPERDVLEQTVADNPAELDARYQLGALKVLEQDYAGAMDEFLAIVQRDRSFRDDGARKALLAVFNILGNERELVSQYRKRMFNALH